MPQHLSYLKWNDALARHFFSPDCEAQIVNLYANEELISDIGAQLGDTFDSFLETVKEGPPWTTRDSLCQKALEAYEGWRHKNLEYPPYIAYLCLFVVAACHEGDFAPHAYYPRLRELLGMEGEGQLPSFDRMLVLWDDLDHWSNIDKDGKLGIFHARITGEWIHVGCPLAQAILSEGERNALPVIFARAGLDASASPPEEEIARILRQHGSDSLKARTLRLLKERGDSERYSTLLATVEEELANWDGHFQDEHGQFGSSRQGFGSVRLCLNVDEIASFARARLRCKLNREFPDEGLTLSADGLGQSLHCEEMAQGWSKPLEDPETDELFDGAKCDWSTGEQFACNELNWSFKLIGRSVRVFVQGEGEGLPGLVEAHALPTGKPFWLAYQDTHWEVLEEWLDEECSGVEHLQISSGLPDGWNLVRVEQVRGDERIRKHLPFLALPDKARLKLEGGIPKRGNTFFAFAPPSLVAEGTRGDESVWCRGEELPPSPDGNTYQLPPGLPIEQGIKIELKRGDEIIQQKTLYLARDFEWTWNQASAGLTREGVPEEIAHLEPPYVAGGAFVGDCPDLSSFRLQPHLAPGLRSSNTRRVFFIGQSPQKIANTPSEPVPEDWDPVWAIPMNRRGEAIFCGRSLDEPVIPQDPGTFKGDARAQLWKQVLWKWRKRIKPPEHPSLRELWNAYLEAARHV